KTKLSLTRNPLSSLVCFLICEICVICVICGRFGLSCRLPTAFCLLFWWRRRELNPDPKVNAEGLYMLSCFSFCARLATRTTFAHLGLSESARRSNELVRLWSRPSPRTEKMGQLN